MLFFDNGYDFRSLALGHALYWSREEVFNVTLLLHNKKQRSKQQRYINWL